MTYVSGSWRRRLAALAALTLASAMLAAPAAGAKRSTCQVNHVSTGVVYGALQAAVDAVSPGAELRVKGTCAGPTIIEKNVTIVGSANKKGAGRPTLDGAGQGRVLTITGGAVVTLRGLTITNGSADRGGGLATIVDHAFGLSVVTIINSVVSGNTATEGGGIDNGQGIVTLVNSAVHDNEAGRGAGIYNSRDNGTLFLQGSSSVSGNTAGEDGGGIYSDTHGHIELSGTSAIHHNRAGGDGGGIYLSDSVVELHDRSTIHHNQAGAVGGGVAKVAPFAVFEVSDRADVHRNSPNNFCEWDPFSSSFDCV